MKYGPLSLSEHVSGKRKGKIHSRRKNVGGKVDQTDNNSTDVQEELHFDHIRMELAIAYSLPS
jgi:hypothetical protein